MKNPNIEQRKEVLQEGLDQELADYWSNPNSFQTQSNNSNKNNTSGNGSSKAEAEANSNAQNTNTNNSTSDIIGDLS
jgi:hypothetical protein